MSPQLGGCGLASENSPCSFPYLCDDQQAQHLQHHSELDYHDGNDDDNDDNDDGNDDDSGGNLNIC